MSLRDVLDDPFATTSSLPPPEEDPERITAGRYRLPDLIVTDGCGAMPASRKLITGTGPRKGGWQRVTTLVKAIGDARALDLWHQRELIKGLVLREDLYDLACSIVSTITDPAELRGELERLASRILEAASTDVGRNLGTAFHGFAEAQDQGMISFARQKWHGKLANYRSGLEAHGLRVLPEYIERKVVILEYGLAGTLDRIVEDTFAGCLRIGDIKSQKTFWTWIEIAAQLAAYGMADAMWDRATRRYVEMPPVAQDLAVVAWTPVNGVSEDDQDGVKFFDVDLEWGRRILRVCAEVNELRSAGRSKTQTIGLLRPLPGLTQVEAYARRLDGVSSLAEGSALWAEIVTRGLSDSPELLEVAQESAQRFLAQPSCN